MSFNRDSFLRCYLEAWLYWILLNGVGGVAFWLVGALLQRPSNPGPFLWFTNVARDPLLLITEGVIAMPLFAALLIGRRRSFRGSE